MTVRPYTVSKFVSNIDQGQCLGFGRKYYFIFYIVPIKGTVVGSIKSAILNSSGTRFREFLGKIFSRNIINSLHK